MKTSLLKNISVVVILFISTIVIVWLATKRMESMTQISRLQSELAGYKKEINDLQSKIDALEKAKLLAEQEAKKSKFPSAELWIDEDRTIHRTAVKNDNGGNLGWVIIYNGRVVLNRNALNETQYRHFRKPGVYTIYLDQFIDGQYRVISNVVSYKIGEDSKDISLNKTSSIPQLSIHNNAGNLSNVIAQAGVEGKEYYEAQAHMILQHICTASFAYYSAQEHPHYPSSMEDLINANPPYIGEEIQKNINGLKNYYIIEIKNGTADAYKAVALPAQEGRKIGLRAFVVDETAIVRQQD